jgi:hypothetical protein
LHKSCLHCYFCNQCQQDKICENYYSIVQQDEDDLIEEMIRDNYIEFYEAWLEYIDDDD